MEVWRRGNRLVKKLLSKKESFTLYDKRPGSAGSKFFFLEMNLFLGEGCEQGETVSSAKSWCEVSVGSF